MKWSPSTEFHDLLAKSGEGDVRLGDILEPFPIRGHAFMIVLFSFPMSIPLAPPFLGGTLGFVLVFLGLDLALEKTPSLPRFLRERLIPSHRFRAIMHRLIRVAKLLESFLRPRLLLLTNMHWVRRCLAIYIPVMALLLSLPVPVPVPFSDTVVAWPIFLTGMGLLERDGLFVVLGYAAALPSMAYYGGIIWFSQGGLELLLRHYGL